MAKHHQHRMSLILEGMPEDDGHIRLTDFLRELQLLSSALQKVERAIAPENRLSTNYRVVNLSHSSPARVVIAAFPKKKRPDIRRAVFATVFSALEQLQQDQVPDSLDYDILEDLHAMAQPVGRTLARLTLEGDEQEVSFTPKFRGTVAGILAPKQIAQGFIRGKLEAINLHEAANVFKIFPRVGPKKLTCHFPSNLLSAAVRAVNQYVEVRGTLKFRSQDPYPYAVDVSEVTALDETASPTFEDIRGIAPDLTGGLPAEDWVAEQRMKHEEELLALLGV